MIYLQESDCRIDDFEALISETLLKDEVTFATEVVNNVPVYTMPDLQATLNHPIERKKLLSEWANVLLNSSGVVVLKKTYEDTSVIDKASALFLNLIEEEKAQSGAKADHFAAKGSNDRLWNSLQKLAKADPALFVDYHANPNIDAVCESWLGPGYQVTAQINLVHPGGKAQQPHRDYHMGFQTNAVCEQYPAHVHSLSPTLTLQGAIAHCDMPIESGVTQLLPFSQRYQPGYLAYRQEAFIACFKQNYVQLPLEKGDTVFFNPAVFHAAGDNKTQDIKRLANLLQVGSAYGRTLENVDRASMCRWVYPELRKRHCDGTLSAAGIHALIAATAEGYSFPTSMDTDPPVGGLAPETQGQLMARLLMEGASVEELELALRALRLKQQPSTDLDQSC